MGLGIGHGLNDPATLADAWRRRLVEEDAASKPQSDPREERAWADEVADRIRKAVMTAHGEQVEVGVFKQGEILVDRGEFYPTRDQLRGGAALLLDYCQQEGLRLFVGGDFKMSGRWNPPFEIIVRLSKEGT